jgi:hypothetical protein
MISATPELPRGPDVQELLDALESESSDEKTRETEKFRAPEAPTAAQEDDI